MGTESALQKSLWLTPLHVKDFLRGFAHRWWGKDGFYLEGAVSIAIDSMTTFYRFV